MRHELTRCTDKAKSYRAILLSILLAFSFACSQSTSRSDTQQIKPSLPTPIPELELPLNWKAFEMGPFELRGPADLKKKNVRGIDSEIYEHENREFDIGVEVGMYSEDSGIHSYEYETGSIMIDGTPVTFTKSDVNVPAANAARNADGSKSKPVEKHLLIVVRFPKEEAVVNVNYPEESLTPNAMAILQSIRVKKQN